MNNYTQIQLHFILNAGILSIAPGFQRSLNSSTAATLSFTRPSGCWFLWKNAKMTRIPFVSLSIVRWWDHRIWVCSRLVSFRLRVLIGHRVSIFSVVEWHKICWKHVPKTVRAQKDNTAMLLINKTVMFIVARIALEFFAGSGKVIPFSVDLADFCRSFRVESNTVFKIYIGLDVPLINDVHSVIERNCLFEILTTIWYRIIFCTHNRLNCKLCWIIRRDLDFILAAHRFLPKEKLCLSSDSIIWIDKLKKSLRTQFICQVLRICCGILQSCRLFSSAFEPLFVIWVTLRRQITAECSCCNAKQCFCSFSIRSN